MWIMFFHVFFCNIIKVNQFLYRFKVLLHSISSFSLTRSLLVLCVYVSIKSIDCILLSAFELKNMLLIFGVKTLYLSLWNLCCIFNINLLFLMNSLWSCLILSMSALMFSRWFIIFSSWVASKHLLKVTNLNFFFMTHFFVSYPFLSSLPSSIE